MKSNEEIGYLVRNTSAGWRPYALLGLCALLGLSLGCVSTSNGRSKDDFVWVGTWHSYRVVDDSRIAETCTYSKNSKFECMATAYQCQGQPCEGDSVLLSGTWSAEGESFTRVISSGAGSPGSESWKVCSRSDMQVVFSGGWVWFRSEADLNRYAADLVSGRRKNGCP